MKFQCDQCRSILTSGAVTDGETVTCPVCGAEIVCHSYCENSIIRCILRFIPLKISKGQKSQAKEGTKEKQYRVPLSIAAMRYAKGLSPKGRASRSEFWWGLLFSCVLDLGLSGIIGGTSLYGLLFLVIVALAIFLGWRRMHDIGRPGWWCLVPFYNLYLSTLPSEHGDNSFGPFPNVQPLEENPVARKVVIGIMSVSALIAVICCFIGDDTHKATPYRVAESTQEDDSEAAARLFSALLLHAQQEQAQLDRWNHMQAEENKRRSSILTEWEQRKARERQIRQEEAIRQDAREKYQRADPGERARMTSFGY